VLFNERAFSQQAIRQIRFLSFGFRVIKNNPLQKFSFNFKYKKLLPTPNNAKNFFLIRHNQQLSAPNLLMNDQNLQGTSLFFPFRQPSLF